MPSPRNQKPGRPHLARDAQQWIFDYVVQQSGLVYHWWSDNSERMPKEIRSHGMIAKHLGRAALALEKEGDEALAAGDREKAMHKYFDAVGDFMRAQHTVFENSPEKLFLYGGLARCFAHVRDLSTYPIELIEVPWNGKVVSGYLHLCPGLGTGPLLVHLPGCDVTCESWPDPFHNPAHARSMHTFSFDGPGQGRCNVNGIPMTPDNYEHAMSAVLDVLVKRPEIDPDRVAVYGPGMGSFWGLRLAALDHRVKAVATNSTYADTYYLMNEESPRWKQLFSYMTQSSTEEELDATMNAMTLDGFMEKIECPTLMVTGEYNLRDPLEEVYRVFDQLKAPGELWVFADQFQRVVLPGGGSANGLMIDWLRDRIDGKPVPHPGEVLYIEPDGVGPASPDVAIKRHWFEQSK